MSAGEMHTAADLYADRMTIDLRQLRALVAVVEEGTFTDAAIALGTSQASVSRAVASLEEALGARVLSRTTRHVATTAVGARVLEHARQALDAVAALERAATHTDAELRVGYAWSALGEHTAPVQRRWAADHPGRQLVFVGSNTPTAGLAEGLADVAVLRRPLTDPRFVVEPVGSEERYAVLPSSDPLARRRTVTLADLAGRTLADLVLGQDTPLTRLPWVGHVSPRWEPEPLRCLGARLVARGVAAADAAEARGRRVGVVPAVLDRLLRH